VKRIALGAALLVVLAVLAAGCGGGGSDTMTKEEYVAGLNTICEDVNGKIDDIGTPTSLEDLADKGEQVLEVYDEGIEEIGELNPPDEAADQHEELVASLKEQRDLSEQAVEAARDGDAEKAQELGGQIAPLETKSDQLATELGADQCAQT